MNKIILIIVVILIVVVGGYFLFKGGYQTPSAPTSTSTPTSTQITTEVVAPEEGASALEVKEITVVGTEFAFSPSAITVQAGQKVKLTFKNEGRAPHNLVIEGFGISTKTIGGGQADIVEFAAPQSGTYTFICSVPGHAAAGMSGDLTVEE